MDTSEAVLLVSKAQSVLGQTRLDIGCGKNKKQGFTGVDRIEFEGVDVVIDIASCRWPWADDSIEEVHCSHFLEHLTAQERCHFANELCRVMKQGAKALIVTPHWNASRAYGDPSHQWPPVSEWLYLYWNKAWRQGNAPHCDAEHVDWGYSCDFDHSSGNSLHQDLLIRSQEFVHFAFQWYKEAIQDLHCTVTKR